MFSESHEEFLELCALSTSGDLSEAERSRLKSHLAICPSCRQAKREYEALAESVLTRIATESEVSERITDDGCWPAEDMEAEFLRLEAEEHKRQSEEQGSGLPVATVPTMAAHRSSFAVGWPLYAAASLLLSSGLAIGAYQYGTHQNPKIIANNQSKEQQTSDQTESEIRSLQAKLSDAGHDLAKTRAELSQREKAIAELRIHLASQSEKMLQLKASMGELKRQSEAGALADASRKQREAESAAKLEDVEAQNRAMRQQLDALQAQASRDRESTVALEARSNALSDDLKAKQDEIDQQRDLLAHDRDIRELMGARDLYMAEIYDVNDAGKTRAAYGRIFYTKEKSLVFYAYDLDRQAGLRNVSTFQVWGRRGPDPQRALKLGVFYQDNASKKRWVMKCNDAKTLAQIDAVFVTVEPNPQSSKPSSKSLLFAYLHMDPNHP